MYLWEIPVRENQILYPDSFINVLKEYQLKKEKYSHSFKQFKYLSGIARYLLMPYAIKPDGLFLKAWAQLRVAAAFVTCLLVPVSLLAWGGLKIAGNTYSRQGDNLYSEAVYSVALRPTLPQNQKVDLPYNVQYNNAKYTYGFTLW